MLQIFIYIFNFRQIVFLITNFTFFATLGKLTDNQILRETRKCNIATIYHALKS